MSSPDTILRRDHRANRAGFLPWAVRATRGEFSIYHSGNLSAARLADPELDSLATLVLLLPDLGWVNAIQCRQSVAYPMDYIAVRTGEGRFPRALATGVISPTDYRVLLQLQDYSAAPVGMSMHRAIRGMLATSSEDAARLVFDRFRTAGWIEQRNARRSDEIQNGPPRWQVSPKGAMMLR